MIEMIKCACGCGELRPKFDSRGRLRRFILHHQRKVPPSEACRKKCIEANTGRTPWNKGLKLPPWSEEHRRKASKIFKSKEFRRRMSAAKLGSTPWNMGLKLPPLSEEHRQKISKGNKEKRRTAEHKGKYSESKKGDKHPHYGKHLPEKTRKKLSIIRKEYLKAHPLSTEQLLKLREGYKEYLRTHPVSGENSPSWLGGLSFEPYGSEFNESLKRKIRERDKYKCNICGKKGKRIHHIDYCKTNNSPSNLITLCVSCHVKTNYNREYWIEYFMNKVPQLEEMLVVV